MIRSTRSGRGVPNVRVIRDTPVVEGKQPIPCYMPKRSAVFIDVAAATAVEEPRVERVTGFGEGATSSPTFPVYSCTLLVGSNHKTVMRILKS